MQQNSLAHRNNNFDFLRLVSAIGVLFSHSYMLLGRESDEPLLRLVNIPISDISIAVFFVVSGYLITQSFDNKPAQYWRSRILRIWPALIVNVLITAFILGAVFTKLNPGEYFTEAETYKYLANLSVLILSWELPGAFKDNSSIMANGSLWTLSNELIMYFLIWCVGKYKLDFKKAIPALGLIFLSLLVSGTPYLTYTFYNSEIFLFPKVKLALLFLIGAGFYIYRDNIIFRSSVLIVLVLLSIITNSLNLTELSVYILLPYAIFYFAFSKSMKLNHTARYGDFSYGIYIYAYPVQQALISVGHGQTSPAILFFKAFIVTLLCAILSWHLIEKRALKLKLKNSP